MLTDNSSIEFLFCNLAGSIPVLYAELIGIILLPPDDFNENCSSGFSTAATYAFSGMYSSSSTPASFNSVSSFCKGMRSNCKMQ
jgi:hypothetical protein